MAIESFTHDELEGLYNTGKAAGIQPVSARRKLLRLMDLIENAAGLEDFQGVSHFHRMTGNRRGSYAFHVTANWRLIFKFKDGDAYDLNYEDPH